MKRRYNYLSHMVDSTTDAVARVVKVSAFWATMAEAVTLINLTLYLGAGYIGVAALVALSFLMWCAVFGVLMITMLSWIAYLTYDPRRNDEDMIIDPAPPTPLYNSKATYYIPTKTGYKIDKIVEKNGGVGGSIDDS